MINRRGLLQLEGLTERIVPAVSIRAVDGDLFISGIPNSGTLTIDVSADNQVTITDGAKNRGDYAVPGDLVLNLSNRNDAVTITMSNSLDGDIIANLRNGNDSLTVSLPDAAGDQSIFGAITVDGGNGTDTLTVVNLDAGALFSIQGGLSFNGGAGNDKAFVNHTTAADAITFGDSVTLTRVNDVDLGTVDDVTISGSLTINNASDKLVTNDYDIGTGVVNIAGALAITGGLGTDTVTLDTVHIVDVVPAEDEVMEISINLDRGSNSLAMDAVEFGMAGTDADFSYTGGKGTDDIDFTGACTISGDATFTLGDGTNTLDTSATTDFDADVTITGGKNGDALTLSTATINGLLTTTLGNGTNELTSAGALDGGLSYTGGSNDDTVTLTDGDNLAGDVSISTGAGQDAVTISGTTTVSVTSLTIDLGIDAVEDTLTYDAVFDALITLLNQGSEDSVTSA